MKLNIYILFVLFVLLIFISLLFILKKREGYNSPTLSYSGKCNDGKDMEIYKNDGLNRWYNDEDTKELLDNIKKMNFDNINNNCKTVNPLKRFHNNSINPDSNTINKIPLGNTNLSTDNIKLMDACDFYDGYNPVTEKKCIENFMANLENEYMNKETNKEKQLSLDDKIYLTICSALFVFLIFKASNKYNM
jgi:hypothetical protein